MKKSGFAKATLGLLVGLSLGLGVLALKAYLAEELIGLLEDEVSSSCAGCHFEVDSVSISLLGLKVVAKNARIMQGSRAALKFDRIDVYVSLRKIREKRIVLSRIDLRAGLADGVGPDSPTFQFIDYLTQPIPPERDRPGRWKAELVALRVLDSKLIEPFTRSRLVGKGVHMIMQRDANNDFVLQPVIDSLSVVSLEKPDGPGFQLGKLSSEVTLTDAIAHFSALKLAHASSEVSGLARSFNDEDNRLEGNLEFHINSEDYDLPDWLAFQIQGSSRLSGSLGRPDVEGTFAQAPETSLQLLSANIPRAEFPTATGMFDIHVRRGESLVRMQSFNASSDADKLYSVNPLTLHNDDVSGKLGFKLETLIFEDGTFHNLQGTVVLSEKDVDIKLTADAHADMVVSHGFTFRDIKLGLTLRGDNLWLEFSHTSDTAGSISGHGQVFLSEPVASIASLDYQYNNFALFQPSLEGSSNAVLESLRFSGAGTLHGPLDITQTAGNASFMLSSTAVTTTSNFQGEANLKSGKLSVKVQDTGGSLETQLTFPLAAPGPSHLSLKAKNIRPEDLFPSLECLDISGAAEYDFDPSAPWGGTGEFNIAGLQFGCAPYTVSLEQPALIKIAAGNAALSPATFRGLDSSVLLQGGLSAASGFDLNAQGHIELNSLVALLPRVDDLRGMLAASLNLKGPVSAPVLTGTASVQNGEFSIEAANISGDSINGKLTLSNRVVSIEHLTGTVNGGTVDLLGQWVPMEPEKSSLQLSATGVTVEPFPNTTLQLGGDIELEAPALGAPLIEGVIRVESGEFQKDLDIANLVRALSNLLFRAPQEVQQRGSLPQVDLNLQVTASRNLFMYTNWAGAEFKGELTIAGDINTPVITGTVESIAGWFGIRDRRFEITSGTLTFRSNTPQPILEIIGETYVPSYTGDTILIIAEARGPLGAPKISFSSDRGLSEREILNLLAIGATQGGQTLVNTASRDLELESKPLFEELSIANLPRLLSSLTRINSLSLQPTYNVQTGLIEPAIVAERKLTEKLSLVGESTLGGVNAESRLKLLYDLTPRLKVAGIAESVSARQENALGVDVTYTVLAKQRDFVKLEFVGNRKIDSSRIMKGIRLSGNARIPVDETGHISESIREYYHDQGYRDAKTTVQCLTGAPFCRHLVVTIIEGQQSNIEEIVLEGDDTADIIDSKKIREVPRRFIASKENLEKRRDELIRALRSEGYIGTRVDAKFNELTEGRDVALVLSIRTGKPVTFTFRGNSHFSPSEFLETINLFKRKQPFGNNTINILIQNMERLYRENGFLYATISASKVEEPESNRITYLIDIVEDVRANVADVRFRGNTSLSRARLERLSAESSLVEHERLFAPEFAVDEEIQENVALLRNIYIEQGFPYVEVAYRLLPQSEASKIVIEYEIVEGEEIRADWLTVEGFPEELKRPAEPAAPYSIPKANRYIDDLLSLLRDRGYLRPALWSDINPETMQMIIHVQTGILTRVGEITFEGTEGIEQKVILRNLKVASGDSWDTDAINESKRNLLRLGLFSRVEILPTDGSVDSAVEDMIVRVSERPLRTLEIGGGVNSELGFHIFGEATDRELFGDGRSLSLRSDLYYDPTEQDISQGIAGLRYSDPYIFGSKFTLAEELRFEKVDLATLEYDLNRVSLASYVYRSWDSGLTLSLGHTILGDNISSVSPDAVLSPLDQGYVTLSILNSVLGFDRRDSPLNPQKGYNLNLETRLASEAILSDANFLGVNGRGSFVTPFRGTRFSFAFGARAGSSWTFGGTPEIPITQRFYLGGRNTVRGFKENSLGPRGSEGSVLGGDMFVSGSTEGRYLVDENLSAHVFLDAGNVFLRGNDDTSYSLRYSSGTGFRFLSPIGPIGFDVGFPINQRSGESSWRFHFNIGTNF